MRVALNLLSAHVGAGVVCNIALLRALAEVDEHGEYHVLLGRTQESLARSVPSRFRVHRLPFDSRRLVARVVVEQLLLPLLLWRWGIDVLYSVGNVTTLMSPCPTVVVVENANPFSIFRLPWTMRQRLRNIVLRHLSRASARRAWRVRFVSQTSRETLVPHLGIPPDKTVVIPHAAGPWDEIQAEDSLPARFVLTVSSLAPHKNLERLVEAFARLAGRGSYEGSLLIAGAPVDRAAARAIEQLCGRFGLERRVALLGEVPHQQLAGLYRRADAFVMVSLEETFGLPVLEAMGFGVPVVVGEEAACRSGRSAGMPPCTAIRSGPRALRKPSIARCPIGAFARSWPRARRPAPPCSVGTRRPARCRPSFRRGAGHTRDRRAATEALMSRSE